jgi:hypothetical protein
MDSGVSRFVLSSMTRATATKSLGRGDLRQILENKRVYRERRLRARISIQEYMELSKLTAIARRMARHVISKGCRKKLSAGT